MERRRDLLQSCAHHCLITLCATYGDVPFYPASSAQTVSSLQLDVTPWYTMGMPGDMSTSRAGVGG